MLTTLLAVNVLCLGAALLLLTRLARPLAPEGNRSPSHASWRSRAAG